MASNEFGPYNYTLQPIICTFHNEPSATNKSYLVKTVLHIRQINSSEKNK